MVPLKTQPNSDILRLSAIWQSGFIPITRPEKASRRLFETRSSRKSGTRLIVSIRGARRRDHLQRPDRQASLRQLAWAYMALNKLDKPAQNRCLASGTVALP